MRTGNPFRTERVREHTVRWKGQPVEVPIVGRRCWQALHLPQAHRPALMLVSGPHVHLVIDAGDRLDTHALTMVTVEPWLRLGQGEKVVDVNASTTDAIALSPGRSRFILPAEGQDYSRNGERFDALMLIDMATGKPDVLRLDRARTPYGHLLEIDAAWIAARWRWVPEARGRERLLVR